MNKFKCWSPDNSDEEDAEEVEALDAEYAARDYGEDRHGDFDYFKELEVCVRDEAGTLTKWTVFAEPSTTFSARETK